MSTMTDVLGRLPLWQSVHLTDAELLGEFVRHRNTDSFAQLFHRLAPMVMGVCRRVLRHQQNAEDAFQATFLVLAQKAASIMPQEKVGCWLYSVAYRTALETRRRARRQQGREASLNACAEPSCAPDGLHQELCAVLDRELLGLPEIYRTPIVLCDLQERTQRDAARQLHLPHGTLSNRLTKGRQLLATRLARLRVHLSVAALAATLHDLAAVPVRLSLTSTTLEQINRGMQAGSFAVATLSQVQHLTQGVLYFMFTRKLTTLAVILLTLLGIGGRLYLSAEAGQQNEVLNSASIPQPQDTSPQAREKTDPFKNAVGWKWMVEPENVFASMSTMGISVMYDSDRKDVIDIVISWVAGQSYLKYRPVAYDADNHRYDLPLLNGGSSTGPQGTVSMQRFRLQTAALKGKPLAKLGIEMLNEKGKAIVAQDAAQRARKLGIEMLSRPEVGQPLKFMLTDIDGKIIRSEDLLGKVVLIDFWATWCNPCMAKMPELKELYQQRRKDGFEIVGISLDHSSEKAKQTIKDKALSWHQVFIPEDEAVRSLWAEAVGVESIPRLLIIDRKGFLRADVGPDQVKSIISKMLGEKE